MTEVPKTGDLYSCKECGMTIEVTADCICDDASCVCFKCCDKEMVKQE